uniref:RING-type domain-containing protein n=1 Tax=Meloidogyne hapla TaxID=6305 RepID=A0A1I8BHN5_MELHA
MTILHNKTQKLHMIPSCKHFIHKKCANERIQKLHKNRIKRSNDDEMEGNYQNNSSARIYGYDFFKFPFNPPSPYSYLNEHVDIINNSNSSSDKEINDLETKINKEEEHSNTLSPNIIINKGNKCPVNDCNSFVQLKKNSNGK